MKIERNDFIEELAVIIKDEFVAQVERVGDKIKVIFLTGEFFWLGLE